MRRYLPQKKRQQGLLKHRTTPRQSKQTMTGKRTRPDTLADDGRRKPPGLRTGTTTQPTPITPPPASRMQHPATEEVHTPRPPVPPSPLGMRLTAGGMQGISRGAARPHFMSRSSAKPDSPFQIRMQSAPDEEAASTGLTPIVPKTIAAPGEILPGIVYSIPDVPPFSRLTPTKPICVEPRTPTPVRARISFLPIESTRIIRISRLELIRTRKIPRRLSANSVMGYSALSIARIAFGLPPKLPPRSFAWMHIHAHSLLGTERQDNFIIGSQGANYRHYVIENLIRLLVLHTGLREINIKYNLIPFANRHDLTALHVFHYLQYELVLKNQLSRKLETIASIKIDLTDQVFPTTQDDDFCFAVVFAQFARLYRIDEMIKNRVVQQIRGVVRKERIFLASLIPYQTPIQPVLERRPVAAALRPVDTHSEVTRQLFPDHPPSPSTLD